MSRCNLICEYCRNPFNSPGYKSVRPMRFCSYACFQQQRKEASDRAKIHRSCKHCGKPISVRPCDARLGIRGTFCSHACELSFRVSPKRARERFWAMVHKDGPIPAHCPERGPCWIWTSTKTLKGYGRFCAFGRYVQAHRFSYELATGETIPANLLACHYCDNPQCVNPGHIFIGDSGANIRDAVAKGRLKPVPPRLRGEQCRRATVTEDQVRMIRILRQSMTTRAVAARFGISMSVVDGIWYGNNWKHVV